MEIFGEIENGYQVVLNKEQGWVKVFLDGTWYTSSIRGGVAKRWRWRSQYKSRNGNQFSRRLWVKMGSDVLFDIAHYVRKYTNLAVKTHPEEGAF